MSESADESWVGRVVVVTGGGRGIGRVCAIDLGRRGAHVVVNDLASNPDFGEADATEVSPAKEVAEAIRRDGGTATWSAESIAHPEGGESVIGHALDEFGQLDAIVHCAGNRRNGPFDQVSSQDIESVLATHLGGAFWITRPAWPTMKSQGHGRIVLVSSGVGAFGLAGLANYAAAKAGQIGLVRALSLEGEEFGIAVNAMLPVANTAREGARPVGRVHRPDVKAALSAVQPQGWRGDPTGVVAALAYMAGRECTLNGAVLSVLGGRVAEVYTSVTEGWTAGTPDELDSSAIASNLEAIRSRRGGWEPSSMVDEIAHVKEAIGAWE